jgi:hypothetical protein
VICVLVSVVVASVSVVVVVGTSEGSVSSALPLHPENIAAVIEAMSVHVVILSNIFLSAKQSIFKSRILKRNESERPIL